MVLHSIAVFGMVNFNESLITFLFVRVSVSASKLTHLIVRALSALNPLYGLMFSLYRMVYDVITTIRH